MHFAKRQSSMYGTHFKHKRELIKWCDFLKFPHKKEYTGTWQTFNGNGLIYQVHIIFKHIMILKHLSEHCFLPQKTLLTLALTRVLSLGTVCLIQRWLIKEQLRYHNQLCRICLTDPSSKTWVFANEGSLTTQLVAQTTGETKLLNFLSFNYNAEKYLWH